MSAGSSHSSSAEERLITALVSRVRNLYAALGLFLVAGLLIALLSLWSLSFLAEEVREGDTLLWDRWFLGQIQRYHRPLLDQAAMNITALGSNLVTTFFGLVGALFFWLSRHRYSAVLLLASIVGSGFLMRTLKALFDRPRPQVFPWLDESVGSSSFPSGHSMNSFVVYMTLALLTARLLPTQAMRLASFATAAILFVAVGATRLYLGVHYLTDVAAGYLAGLLWIATCVSALEVVRRFRRRQPEIARQEEDLEP